MRVRWLLVVVVVSVALVAVVGAAPMLCAAETAPAAEQGGASTVPQQERPTERVSPAPEVNLNAVVWRTPEQPANPQAGDVWVNPKDSKEMVHVAAGEFLMGSREGWTNWGPQRPVYVDGFWMEKCEVTVAEYRRFCRAKGREMPDAPRWGWKDDHPIVNVSWQDARDYAQWAGKRLPTEAEWGKAARGTDGRRYPWGNEAPGTSRCNRNGSEDGYEYAAPVGSFPSGASPYGCLDMGGNVREWCADWHATYAWSPWGYGGRKDRIPGPDVLLNPKGPDRGAAKVVRGGCWRYRAEPVLCFSRDWAGGPEFSNPWVGFRCARDAE